MIYLVNPSELIKEKCTTKDFTCTTFCKGVVYPMYGVPPVPL
ncbi:MAG: hypothetical protein PVH24_04305 [Candidatus Zixiibacteriota bacterium]|jgi:hypothetical protein